MIAAVNSKVSNYEKKMRLGEIYNRTDSKSIMRMKSGQMFAREDLRHRKLIRDGPVSLKNSAGRLKGEVSCLLLWRMQLTLSRSGISPQIGTSTFDLFFCFDRLWQQLSPAVPPLPSAFPIPCVGSGVTESCFSSWCLLRGGSDSSGCQPRSRVAQGCSEPGGHDWGCSYPEHCSIPVPQFQELCWLDLEPSLKFPGLSFPPRAVAGLQQLHWDPGRCPRHLLLLNLLSCWHKLFRRGSGVPAAASCWVSVFLSCFLFVIRWK